jgi:uncharacterized membrane protein HdeD (DUF308 family)
MSSPKSSIRRSYFIDGLLLIALGLFMLIYPGDSLKIVCTVIGAVIAVMGVIKVITFFTNGADKPWIDLGVAIVQVAVGVLLITRSNTFISAFNIIVGIVLLYGAITMLVGAICMAKATGITFVLSIVFAVITGILAVIILANPAGFASFIEQLRGIALIIEGVEMLLVLRK